MGRPRKVVSIISDGNQVELIDNNVDETEIAGLEKLAESPNNENLDDEAKEKIPNMFSAEWSDYVLSQLLPDEKSDEKPTVEGLRRVSQMLLGPIVNSRPTHVVGNGNQTIVGYSVTFLWNRGDDARFGSEVTFGSCADTTEENAGHPFNKYGAAMSDTRAEGRALKKALGLRRVLTAEEANLELQMPSKDAITSSQLAAIKNLCRKQDINIKKFVEMFCAENGIDTPAAIEQLTKDTAIKMCAELNNFNVDVKNDDYKVIPSEIKGFE